MDLSPMMAGLVGIVPLIVLFVGLGFTKLPAHVVAVTTAVLAVVLAGTVWSAHGSLLLWAGGEGLVTALVPILWVVFAAVFVFLVSTATGGMDVFRHYLAGVAPSRELQVVLVAFCLGGFLEAVAGFGTAVAIPAAMLITLGLEPVKATVLCLVANSVPVAFGALGIPVLALANVTQLDTSILTRDVVLQLTPFAVLVPVALVYLTHGNWRGIAPFLAEALLIGLIFAGTQILVAWTIGPELVAVGGSLAALIGYVIYRRFRDQDSHPLHGLKWQELGMALLPFACLLGLVLVTRLLPMPLLRAPPFLWTFGPADHRITVDLAYTPGTLLFISALIGALAGRLPASRIVQLLREAAWKIRWTSVIVISILVMAKVMAGSGMITDVAQMLAVSAGGLFPLLSPWLGAMGTFVTGSDTSSNILLGALQKETALRTGFDPAWLAAANTAGATAGKMISPQSISVGASTVGVESRQQEILRTTLRYCAAYLVLLSLLVYLGARWHWGL
jgi:lactate permease